MKFRSFLVFLAVTGLSFAELINVNPDPKGEPWIAGGLKIPSDFDVSRLDFIPVNSHTKIELPSRVDNSEHKFFRPIFNQVGGSCSQAAGVGYTYTYEINRLRNLASDTFETQYPTHFTYNFLNEGSGEVGSWWGDGWDIIESVGIMNVQEYGGHFASGGNSRWISGIEEWKSGHSNSVNSYNAIEVGTPEGLNTLKHWLHNHLEDSPYGGLAVFAAGATNYTIRNLPEGTHEAGKKVVTQWGPDVNHAMTFIGYDDSIRFDYNGDGIYTNHLDINGDGVVDMRDWEIGGLIVANSWGDWADGGKTYMMYKLLADTYQDGGIFWHFCDIIYPRTEESPRYTLEVKMKHERRNLYRIATGASFDINQEYPDNFKNYPYMNFQGGDFYPQGGKNDEDKYIDFSMDVTESLTDINTAEPFRFFFLTDENDPSDQYNGEIISVVFVDNLTGRRYYNTDGSIPVTNNGRTIVSILVDENTFIPENLTAFGGDGIVRLEWTGLDRKISYFENYRVYKNGELYATSLADTSFTDENVENGNLYTYKVSALFSGTFSGELFSFPVQTMPKEPSELPYFIDFESGSEDWTIKGDLSGWLLGDDSYNSEFANYSTNQSSFILANPDLAGNRETVKDHAVSPLFNLSFYDEVRLDFDYYLYNETTQDYYCDISVLYRTGIEQDWILIEMLDYTADWTNKTVQIPYDAVSSNYTQFAFFIDDHNKWSMGAAAVDNINISGVFNTYPPRITAYFPEDILFTISDLEPVTFSVEVYDEDTGISELNFKWYVNGELKQEGGTEFIKIFGYQGDYTVKVTVSDKYDEVSNEWTITQTDIEHNLPQTTKLYQNYPNPFNPSTVIRFDNASDNFTSMQIFNSNGQLVRELLNRKLKPGSYSVNWDGRDNSGVALSSGIYYCTLISGDYTKTFKMMLFK